MLSLSGHYLRQWERESHNCTNGHFHFFRAHLNKNALGGRHTHTSFFFLTTVQLQPLFCHHLEISVNTSMARWPFYLFESISDNTIWLEKKFQIKTKHDAPSTDGKSSWLKFLFRSNLDCDCYRLFKLSLSSRGTQGQANGFKFEQIFVLILTIVLSKRWQQWYRMARARFGIDCWEKKINENRLSEREWDSEHTHTHTCGDTRHVFTRWGVSRYGNDDKSLRGTATMWSSFFWNKRSDAHAIFMELKKC